jgi:hypothetical protein
MNAVEIEAAISDLVQEPFDPAEFPFAFLAAFGNKETTVRRLRKGDSNSSDVKGAVLQRSNIHLGIAEPGKVEEMFAALKQSPKNAAAKAKFVLATDGEYIQAEELSTNDPLNCKFSELPANFAFFLPLAGITTVKEIKDNPIDIRATGRLNKLYIELLKLNPDWASEDRRSDMNHFMSRLIFCFFAEDTDIFMGEGLFTKTIQQMSEPNGSNVDHVLSKIFEAMNVKTSDRIDSDLPPFANQFPYVNGGLFGGSVDVPKFSQIARSYLIGAGELNWKEINPDIFGSMIQAIADDEERGSLGMHYTSVPNILKVLNPLFLDDLRDQLNRAGEHKASLLKLRQRMSGIRLFDPACGSGNFLVIAYKEMRAIEGEINRRRNEIDRPSEIHLTNFRGIEIRDFAAEMARLALIIAEFQCDVLYRGPKLALAEFLPLDTENWIVCGNALRLDWTRVCPPISKDVSVVSTADDLFDTVLDQPRIEFQNEGGETYVCGNPPYLGSQLQTSANKSDLKLIFQELEKRWPSLDYICGWFWKSVTFLGENPGGIALVTTNSITQGEHVPILWPHILQRGWSILFAYTSFKWSNLAASNAGVTVAIIGLSKDPPQIKTIFEHDADGMLARREVRNINPYLVGFDNIIVYPAQPPTDRGSMLKGNMPTDGGNLILDAETRDRLIAAHPDTDRFVFSYFGSRELIRGEKRFCIWVNDDDYEEARKFPELEARFKMVADERTKSKAITTRPFAKWPYKFRQIQGVGVNVSLAIPSVSSEGRDFLPVSLLPSKTIVSNLAFAIYDAPLWNMALIASKLHIVWIGTVCGKLKTDYRYSNTLGWNTFPVPVLTEEQKSELTRCAEDILLAREAHFPATIADLYDPEKMPENLRQAHDRNDEVLERIYIGRRFKNDTERLEKLFEMYAKMVKDNPSQTTKSKRNHGK